MEESSRVDRLISIDVAERFEVLQDEVNLLKMEIKQNLVDLREVLMKEHTVFPSWQRENHREELPGPVSEPPLLLEPLAPAPRTTTPAVSQPGPLPVPLRLPDAQVLDPVLLGGIIGWLGTVKDNGLSLQLVSPYLEAYEVAGYLSSVMVKVVLRAMADLDQQAGTTQGRDFSPHQYAECVAQLHRIVCGHVLEEAPAAPEPVLEVLPSLNGQQKPYQLEEETTPGRLEEPSDTREESGEDG